MVPGFATFFFFFNPSAARVVNHWPVFLKSLLCGPAVSVYKHFELIMEIPPPPSYTECRQMRNISHRTITWFISIFNFLQSLKHVLQLFQMLLPGRNPWPKFSTALSPTSIKSPGKGSWSVCLNWLVIQQLFSFPFLCLLEAFPAALQLSSLKTLRQRKIRKGSF